MARKLNTKEQSDFLNAVQAIEALPPESIETAFWRKLTEQRDAAMVLTPELSEWFGHEVTAELEP